MKSSRILATLGLAAATLAVAAPAPADTDTAPGLYPMATAVEQGCHELIISRGGNAAAVRAAVPARYTLLNNSATVTTYTCEDVTVDGQPNIGSGPTTTTIGTVGGTHRDGAELGANSRYILWHGTDNPVLFAKYQQVGLPTQLLHPSTEAAAVETPTSTAAWSIRGKGLDYDITEAIPTGAPGQPPVTPQVTWYHEGPDGTVELALDNNTRQSTALTRATLSGLEPLFGLLANPALATIPLPNTIPPALAYITGGWTSTLIVH